MPNRTVAAQMAALHAMVDELKRDTAEQIAEQAAKITALEQQRRDVPPPEWIALKAADRGQFSYEAVRKWCEDGVIVAEKRRGRWFVNVASLNARLACLAAA